MARREELTGEQWAILAPLTPVSKRRAGGRGRPLDQRLAAQGIELIAPHRRNRNRIPPQEGRALRRYRRRWQVERLFAWLHKYRRVMTPWDRCRERFTAFVHLALAMLLWRRLQRCL
jgi:transposase